MSWLDFMAVVAVGFVPGLLYGFVLGFRAASTAPTTGGREP